MNRLALIALPAVALGASAALAATIVGSRGDLSPVRGNSGGREGGFYRLAVVDADRRGKFERIEAGARRLDTTPDATTQARPAYNVWLVNSDTSAEADFGRMRLNRRGSAQFIFDTRRASLPSGVTSLTDFSAGTIEVRNAAGAVLNATLADFAR